MPMTSAKARLEARVEASTEIGAAPECVVAGRCPEGLVAALREQVGLGLDWQQTSDRVVETLRRMLPEPAELLPADLRRGNPACYQSHLVHAEPDGSFSVGVMVWLPGQATVIHDHVAWCVTGVLQGCEYEEVFAVAESGAALRPVARNRNEAGLVSGFAPPGDIHRVRNCGSDVAISMHVYGADISRLGNSIRREYALPILP
ncbi:MAG TPA: cysteine dioxygenase family protein [Streptosporangiaceae bacterium]|jgi:predicted metal-dependent enzyme (double-stranded beta helix superfamily)